MRLVPTISASAPSISLEESFCWIGRPNGFEVDGESDAAVPHLRTKPQRFLRSRRHESDVDDVQALGAVQEKEEKGKEEKGEEGKEKRGKGFCLLLLLGVLSNERTAKGQARRRRRFQKGKPPHLRKPNDHPGVLHYRVSAIREMLADRRLSFKGRPPTSVVLLDTIQLVKGSF